MPIKESFVPTADQDIAKIRGIFIVNAVALEKRPKFNLRYNIFINEVIVVLFS